MSGDCPPAASNAAHLGSFGQKSWSVWASTKPGKLELGFVWPNRWLRSADNARQRAAAMPSMSGAFDDDVSGLRAQSAADHYANKRGRNVASSARVQRGAKRWCES